MPFTQKTTEGEEEPRIKGMEEPSIHGLETDKIHGLETDKIIGLGDVGKKREEVSGLIEEDEEEEPEIKVKEIPGVKEAGKKYMEMWNKFTTENINNWTEDEFDAELDILSEQYKKMDKDEQNIVMDALHEESKLMRKYREEEEEEKK